ncbi:flagellar hook-basal body complex protein [Pseudodesulfovibrio cashew]|uniref:Flagellar hook protein FlgE n=1 Tax=Pseudodesulfovibrio cashew TaxID=2678688 RepID=A0A6I6JA57_9BACT|nr:flagellar hook protein FlgE [Pseudodesulfovibrio cashew]QGY39555.1 flagellar hook-basal body complex protein [Pseudodesulfovibrio cashew]
MSITGSMYTGISGLQAQSEATSVVSNNLANSTTTAYKSSSVQFEDVFYSTIYAGGSSDQIGNGVTVASVNTDYSQGSYESTNSDTDVAINGDGFYIVVDPDTNTTYYTRAGNFSFDTEGYLVDAHGNRVQGWAMEDGSISGSLVDIQLDESQSPPSATTEVQFALNLDSTETDNATSSTDPYTALFNYYDGTQDPPIGDSLYAYSTTITIYDENGSSHDLTVYFDKVETSDDGSIVWEYLVTCDADEDERVFSGTDLDTTSAAGLLMAGTITFDTSGQLISTTAFTLSDTPSSTDPLDMDNWELAEFDDEGSPVLEANFTGADENQEIGFNIGLTNTDFASGSGWDTSGGITTLSAIGTADPDDLPTFNNAVLGTSATTSYSDSSATYSLLQDGYAPGTLIDVSIDENGVLSGNYTNGQSEELYSFALADFTNLQGLYSEGSNLYSATTDSGQARIGTAGSAGFGTITANALEQSNVDTATELTNLIILQAAYQANSKIITTADTLLSTAISMKR